MHGRCEGGFPAPLLLAPCCLLGAGLGASQFQSGQAQGPGRQPPHTEGTFKAHQPVQLPGALPGTRPAQFSWLYRPEVGAGVDLDPATWLGPCWRLGEDPASHSQMVGSAGMKEGGPGSQLSCPQHLPTGALGTSTPQLAQPPLGGPPGRLLPVVTANSGIGYRGHVNQRVRAELAVSSLRNPASVRLPAGSRWAILPPRPSAPRATGL